VDVRAPRQTIWIQRVGQDINRAAYLRIVLAWPIMLDQGLAGVEQATTTGLVFGTTFPITDRIFMLMVAHAAFDLTAVAIIYWNLESKSGSFYLPVVLGRKNQ